MQEGNRLHYLADRAGIRGHDETWVLFNAMNGNRAEMSPEAAGIAACLMTYSHHACRMENYAMTVHYYRLRDYALQHPECSAIMRIID
ncbi:antirestriction protein [Escherichia coli]|nr:antirestriction protein [Escherichia coli]